MINNYFSIADFFDAYHKIRLSGIQFILGRLHLKKLDRTRKAWQHTEGLPQSWLDIPYVRQRINKIISGDSRTTVPEYIGHKYITGTNIKILSPGCGTGSLELSLSEFDSIGLIDAFDISEPRIEAAKKQLNPSNHKVNFFVNDIYQYHFHHKKYDMIIFNGFLHHVRKVDTLLDEIKCALNDGGHLIINEYVGPNRFQWRQNQLDVVNRRLKEIPSDQRKFMNSKHTKNRHYRPGKIRMILSDPSEAIDSEHIVPALKNHFKTVEIRNIGGNILHLLLKNIAHHFIHKNRETIRLLDDLFKAEDDFLLENSSDFIFGVFQKPKD